MVLDPRLQQTIPELRRKYKEIFLIDLSGQPDESRITSNLLIRPLTRQEFLFTQSDVELGCDPTETILKDGIIWPEIDWDDDSHAIFDLPYMCFEKLAECIIDISGFSSNENIAMHFNVARHEINSMDSLLLAVITNHFSSIKPEDFDNMTLSEITKLFAIAETNLEQPVDLRLFLDPEYAQRKLDAQKRRDAKQQTFAPGARLQKQIGALQPPEGWNSAQSRE